MISKGFGFVAFFESVKARGSTGLNILVTNIIAMDNEF